MSASASSLFTNFRPFFVSGYEGREELCREIQARRHHCKPNQCKVTAVPALLFVHSGAGVLVVLWVGLSPFPGVLVFVRVFPSTSGFL